MFKVCRHFFDFVNFLEENNRYKVDIFRINLVFDGLSNDISHFVVTQIFVISTCLRYVDNTDSVNFLEEYYRYEVDIFSVNLIFKRLSSDISLFVVAQNFIVSTCLRYVDNTDFVNFLEDYNRYEIDKSSVNLIFKRLSNDISIIFVA